MASGSDRWSKLGKSVCFGAVSGATSSLLLQPFDRIKTESDRWSKLGKSVCFGAVSGATSSLLLQPFDRIKTAMQDPSSVRRSFTHTARFVISRDGVAGLWRGLTPSMLRVVPGVALYLGSVEWFHVFVMDERPASSAQNFLFGVVARTFAEIVLMPATVLKTRFESHFYRDKNFRQLITAVFKQDGYRGFFTGMVPSILRDAPFAGIYLTCYRKQLSLLPPDVIESRWEPMWRFACGCSAGLIACAVTQPFDVVKTHMQLFPSKYRSFPVVCATLFKESGLSIFFLGFLPRAMRRTSMAALNWTLFDEMRRRTRKK
uniref:Solute carrier family 25 member 38 n=1 Tax=Plectus sambesii TaxID=2011161 RepID=A0A914VRM2_9BILA